MKKKYQVFISSTYTDLVDERQAVTQCLLDNDCIPVGMEQFPASGMEQMEYIKKMLNDCDYYILILAGRYGSLDADGIGFTEKEFDYANSKGLPIMSFVIRDPNSILFANSEQTEDAQNKLKAFRKKVCTGRMVTYYENIDQLKAKVATSINKCIKDFPSIGWIRVDDSSSDIKAQIANYSESHTALVKDIDALFQNVFTESPPLPDHALYTNPETRGSFTFDYSNNNGEFVIGCGENSFTTKWSKASDARIHAYKDGNGILAIARIKSPIELKDALSFKCDFSSRSRTPSIGDIIVWKNTFGKYAATKILQIKDDTRGSENDELSCEYLIFD